MAAANTSATVTELLRRHQPSPQAAIAIARAVTATAFLGTAEKDFYRVAAQWNGRGPFEILIADVRPGGHLRCYVGQPQTAVDSVEQGIGPGVLTVSRQDPEGRLVQGSLPLASSRVDEDIEHYLRHSEQIPSRLRVFVTVGDSGLPLSVAGVLVQTLPGGAAETLLEQGGALSPGFFERSLSPEQSLDSLLSQVFSAQAVEVLSEECIDFRCQCSLERVERGVAMLGPDELLDMIAKEEPAEVRCDFCNEHYRVDIPGLCRIYDSLTGGESRD